MKASCFAWIALAALTLAVAEAPAQQRTGIAGRQDGKELVAILQFAGVGTSIADVAALTDRLQDALLKQGKFVLVDRSQMDAILNEQAFQQTGCTSQECAVKAGKILGVRKIVTARVVKLSESEWQISAQLTDVESAEIVRAESLSYRGNLLSLLDTATLQLAERLASARDASSLATPLTPFTQAAPAPSRADQSLRTFSGHSGAVNGVAFSPDGRLILSGSTDTTVRLWDVSTGNEIRAFSGRAGEVASIAYSSDGRQALTGSRNNNTMILWDVETGTEARTFRGHAGSVNAVAFSPDRGRAVSGSSDKTLKLWELDTGKVIRTFSEDFTTPILSLAVSPNGRLILCGELNTVRLWELATGKTVRYFRGGSGFFRGVAFSTDGKLALAATGRLPKLWDVETGDEVRSLSKEGGLVHAVAFSPNGRDALSSSSTALVYWEVATGREIRSYRGHTGPVTSVVFSPDGRLAASGSYDKSVRIWEIAP